jgi:hypothetical protein
MRVRKIGLRLVVLAFFASAFMTLAACSSSSGDTTLDGACSGAGATITRVGDHVHDVDIPDMDTVRSREATYTTTVDDGHTHEITIDVLDFAQINQGNMIYKVTTRSADHAHPVEIGCVY